MYISYKWGVYPPNIHGAMPQQPYGAIPQHLPH